ncbi:DUF4058 family protein [Anatilimnocola sp. NA78]|uniref:DUF4058 family protein n=1 Tax=Anatilimnocola sp. NA78 TaxID=3415683 RepID=UPI003CE4D8E7
MPSPFPGMDPFIEMDEWQEFHSGMIAQFHRQLAKAVAPRYLARMERRVYLERTFDDPTLRQPDIHIAHASRKTAPRKPVANSSLATIEPRVYEVPLPVEHSELYLVIKDRKNREIVTVIELLSPTNKAVGTDGRREYLTKRDELLQRKVNLVEIDLLRVGSRPATTKPLEPKTDFCVFVHRLELRPKVLVYEWSIRDPLPPIPIPLAAGDADVPLHLQEAFTEFYDVAQYAIALDYGESLQPPLRKADATWARRCVSEWRKHQNP